jgi:hypothetical protein
MILNMILMAETCDPPFQTYGSMDIEILEEVPQAWAIDTSATRGT